MEAVVFRSTSQHQIRSLKKTPRSFVSRSSENLAPGIFPGGLLSVPPPSYLSYSFPPSNNYNYPQPPLLPLPISRPSDHNPRIRNLSCSPVNRKTGNKKKRQSAKSPKKPDPKSVESSKCLIVESVNRLGPDPNHLPKDVSKVLSLSLPPSAASSGNVNNSTNSDLSVSGDDKFSGSAVFTISPPPSSLPLPTFSLRPKLICKVEAAGIDTGATDNLRRLLRLR